MRRTTALALVGVALAGAVALVFSLPETPLPGSAVGSAPPPVVRSGATGLRWTAPVGIVGLAAQGGTATQIDVGGVRAPGGPFVWLDGGCRVVAERPPDGVSCKTAAVGVVWAGAPGTLHPVYAGTRVFWTGLDARGRELLRAYGVAPLAPAPAPQSLRESDLLIVPRAEPIDTPARVLALRPDARGYGKTRRIGSLRARAQFGPGDEGARVALAVEGVPVLFAQGRTFRPTIDVPATVDALRFGWGDGLADVDGNGERQPRDRFPGVTVHDVASPGTDVLVDAILGEVLGDDDPRISSVPAGAPALLVLTADQDYAPAAAVLAQSQAAQGVGMTFLLTTPRAGKAPDVAFVEAPTGMLARDVVAQLAERGHGVGIHPFISDAETTGKVAAEFHRAYGSAPRVIRNHHVTWPDGDGARGQAGLGLGLDYIAQASAGSDLGFLGGTGVPMRYPGTQVLQLPTQLDDHVLLPAEFGYRAYDVRTLSERSAAVLDVACEHGSVVVANHHPIWWIETDGAWQRALLDAAAARNVPVWGATQYLRYVEGARSPVVWRGDDGRWRALVPEAGMTVVLAGARHALEPGVRDVLTGARQ